MQLIQAADWSQPFRIRLHQSSENSMRKCPLFNERKVSATGYKGSASELVTLLPLLEFTCHTLAPMTEPGKALEALHLKCQSFLAVCHVGRTYMNLKRGGISEAGARNMELALKQHGMCFIAAYGEGMCKPKKHFSFHVPQHAIMLKKECEMKNLPDCWPGERKNKDYKELCDNGRLAKLAGLEKSALSRLLNIQLQDMKRQPLMFEDHLGEPSYDCSGILKGCRIANHLQLSNVEVGVHDVFLSGDNAFALQVVACISLGSDIGLLVKKMQLASRHGNSLKYRTAECPLQLLRKIDTSLHTCTCFAFGSTFCSCKIVLHIRNHSQLTRLSNQDNLHLASFWHLREESCFVFFCLWLVCT